MTGTDDTSCFDGAGSWGAIKIAAMCWSTQFNDCRNFGAFESIITRCAFSWEVLLRLGGARECFNMAHVWLVMFIRNNLLTCARQRVMCCLPSVPGVDVVKLAEKKVSLQDIALGKKKMAAALRR